MAEAVGTSEAQRTAPDSITRYCRAAVECDIDSLLETMAPTPELVSPLSGRMVFRGRDDVRVLLTAIYGTLTDLRWNEPFGDGRRWAALAEGRVLGARFGDAMVFELDEHGRIERVRPYLRPWLGLTVFALALGPRMAAKPGVIWRALRAGARQRA